MHLETSLAILVKILSLSCFEQLNDFLGIFLIFPMQVFTISTSVVFHVVTFDTFWTRRENYSNRIISVFSLSLIFPFETSRVPLWILYDTLDTFYDRVSFSLLIEFLVVSFKLWLLSSFKILAFRHRWKKKN
ncbi:hypothetical protein C479_13398 [Halovivax asiaticus JCM 14624]|uniref:Uncharacterized protein n=1 Tax=Halovivax asiaticus JCM 14624 TaxID=1227490 RepID=M0BCY2_9EURY|nr:hypothetical protein C479_13398 [Halovivax asiaticus JCM 14624]